MQIILSINMKHSLAMDTLIGGYTFKAYIAEWNRFWGIIQECNASLLS